MRTLKEEEVNGTAYRDLDDARTRIGEFLEQEYNRKRLHSAVGYRKRPKFPSWAQIESVFRCPLKLSGHLFAR
jgi:transposase InsO family protein